MQLYAGLFIKSTAALNDTVFEAVTIFIAEYNSAGATGFIINKHFPRRLNELVKFKNSPPFPLYEGGPVDQEHLFFMHKRPDLIKEGIVVDNVCYGGDFKQAVAAINEKILTVADIKIFIGYCGWDAGELEAEIEEGSWTICDSGEHVFMQ